MHAEGGSNFPRHHNQIETIKQLPHLLEECEDLKLEYGTANINDLSQYDQNYTLLVRTLQKWAEALAAADHPRLIRFSVLK